MKKFVYLAFFIVFAAVIPDLALSQGKADLAGTWKGSSFANGPDIDLMFTLVIELKDGNITGKMNDDMGYVDTEIRKVTFENNVLKFDLTAQTPDGGLEVSFEMNVKKDELDGKWEAVDGTYGSWKAKKVVAEKVDLTGTWVGQATISSGTNPNVLTLVMTKEAGKLAGKITGQYGTLTDSKLKSIKYEAGVFTFDVDGTNQGNTFTLRFKMNVKDSKMTGTYDVVGMQMNGTWEAVKK